MKDLQKVTRALTDIVWQFGPKGINGECCQDLSLPEFRALQKIAETPSCNVQEIGIHLGFTKSGATRIVSRLEKKGYISKQKSLEDARICCLLTTDKGQSILAFVATQYAEQLSAALHKTGEHNKEIQKSIIALAKFL